MNTVGTSSYRETISYFNAAMKQAKVAFLFDLSLKIALFQFVLSF